MPQAADPLPEAVARLSAAGCESPRLDAELLLAEVLGTSRTALYLRPPRRLEPSARAGFERLPEANLVNRRSLTLCGTRVSLTNLERSVTLSGFIMSSIHSTS